MFEMLQDIVAQRCQDWGGELLDFNGEADHVHILMSLPPNLDLSRFVNNAKTTSSNWSGESSVISFDAFIASYCIISCGGAPSR
jgi:putative transposase